MFLGSLTLFSPIWWGVLIVCSSGARLIVRVLGVCRVFFQDENQSTGIRFVPRTSGS